MDTLVDIGMLSSDDLHLTWMCTVYNKFRGWDLFHVWGHHCALLNQEMRRQGKFHPHLIRNDIQERVVVWYQSAFKTLDGLDTDENVLAAGVG